MTCPAGWIQPILILTLVKGVQFYERSEVCLFSFSRPAGLTWIPEIRNESFDRVSPIIYFQ